MVTTNIDDHTRYFGFQMNLKTDAVLKVTLETAATSTW